MKKIIILISFLITSVCLSQSNTYKQIDYFSFDGKKVSNFFVDSETQKLAVYFSGKDYNKLSVYDYNKNLVWEKSFEEYGYIVYDKSKIYLAFNDKILALDLNTLKHQTFEIPEDIWYREFDKSKDESPYFTLETNKYISILDSKDFKFIKKINRSDKIRSRCSLLAQNIYVFLDFGNTAKAYSINKDKILWKFNSGEEDISFLGIGVGSVENGIRVMSLLDDSTVIMSTWFGDVYKINLFTGNIIKKIENIGGSGNNAGLISNLTIIDLENDGTPEIIAPSVDENIYVIDSEEMKTKWQFDADEELQKSATAFDVNQDGVKDIIFTTDELELFVLNGKNGKIIYKKELQEENDFGQSNIIITQWENSNKKFLFAKGRDENENDIIYKINIDHIRNNETKD